ncbi:MAG: hypothetical protein H7240_04810 [Glaciimonas sp.]|nr:hypothetical protein [Glaciimonas sp.]
MAIALEQVRFILGAKELHISSGYRCVALNKKVGGAANSAHLSGLAVDFTCAKFVSPRET